MSINIFKNKKLLTQLIAASVFSIFILPAITNAAIVNCDGSAQHPCDFNAFISMINGIISWIISIAGVIFTISLIYGGFLYVTAGEKASSKETAKKVLWSTFKGFVIILVSWLIVYTILNYLVDPSQKDAVLKFIGNGN